MPALRVRPRLLAAALPACSATQLSGAGYSRLQDLTGANPTAQTDSATVSDVITAGAGQVSVPNFSGTQRDGVNYCWSNTRAGFIGTGPANTVVKLPDGVSSITPPATGTNQFYLLHYNHSALQLKCFTLDGGTQAAGQFFNGIRLASITGGTISDVDLVNAAPGFKAFPPGETFGWNGFGSSGITWTDCDVDGGGDGATAFGANSYSGFTYTRCRAWENRYSAAFALWQDGGAGTTTTLRDCQSWNNRTALNLERCAGRIDAINFSFGQYDLNTVGEGFGQDIFWGNDQSAAGELWLYDPIIDPARTYGGRQAGKLYIFYPTLEQGATNLATKANVHIVIGGSEVPFANQTDYIQWSR